MKLRLVRHIGTRGFRRIYWGGGGIGSPCPNCLGGGRPGYHNGLALIGRCDLLEAHDAFGTVEEHPTGWPEKCDHCEALVPADGVHRQIFTQRDYDTASGSPEPGDIFVASNWYDGPDHGGRCILGGWTNCDGQHLVVITPDGDTWDLMSRAANCSKRTDTTHRCWVVTGRPELGELVTVGKAGETCDAGQGSIITARGGHYMLENGVFRSV